jgi:hypothetical protein
MMAQTAKPVTTLARSVLVEAILSAACARLATHLYPIMALRRVNFLRYNQLIV